MSVSSGCSNQRRVLTPEDGGCKLLRNIGKILAMDMTQYPKRPDHNHQ